MAKYNVKFSCGHNETIELFGKVSERMRRIEYYGENCLCSDCRKAEREKMYNEFLEKMNAPELVGTEAQVKYAEDIRTKVFFKVGTGTVSGCEEDQNDFKEAVRTLFHDFSQSKFWIEEFKDFNPIRTASYMAKTINSHIDKWNESIKDAERKADEERNKNPALIPQNHTHGGVVRVTIGENFIDTIYVQDDSFRRIVKDAGYRWNGSNWHRNIDCFNGPLKDRAADLCNKLLLNGFSVDVQDDDVRAMAVDCSFQPECKKWVHTFDSDVGWLGIEIPYGEDRLYRLAREIKGSRWDKGFVMCPISRYNEVLDFADSNGYKVSDTSAKEIEKYKESIGIFVSPVKKDVEKTDKLNDILNSSDDVIPDLLDD